VTDHIKKIANRTRELLGITGDIYLDAADVLLRLRIAKIIKNFVVVPDATLTGAQARWDPESRTIAIQQAVWNLLEKGNHEARFTIFHEVGHAVLGHSKRYRKAEGAVQFGQYTQLDEADADEFAMMFAIPDDLAKTTSVTSPEELSERFGFPLSFASKRLVTLQKTYRASRRVRQEFADEEFDSYGEAIAIMMRNAIRWNS
jgi:hypothetical protein